MFPFSFFQGAHKRLGEAYLPLQEICEDENMDRDLAELPQLQLPLIRPQDQGDC